MSDIGLATGRSQAWSVSDMGQGTREEYVQSSTISRGGGASVLGLRDFS
eukprot:CAMPEP_0197457250 /NCGR_PEP_ID=MMETSP1175-20131217/45514_1 /TAXON_ID=1003142 /ORGANISM="Triceratium dubium, Strain CCMP147" /LENGTH=48 /DNA_ID= /DNA_START= /DNA_END= /DNA_ORIENTATION=